MSIIKQNEDYASTRKSTLSVTRHWSHTCHSNWRPCFCPIGSIIIHAPCVLCRMLLLLTMYGCIHIKVWYHISLQRDRATVGVSLVWGPIWVVIIAGIVNLVHVSKCSSIGSIDSVRGEMTTKGPWSIVCTSHWICGMTAKTLVCIERWMEIFFNWKLESWYIIWGLIRMKYIRLSHLTNQPMFEVC